MAMMTMGLSFTYPALSLLTIPSLVVAGLSYGLGVGPAPNILMSTLFTQNMKTNGVTTGRIARALVNTIQLKVTESLVLILPPRCNIFQIFPWISEAVGVNGVFFIMSAIGFIGAFFSRFLIPATRNKTISELNKLFVKEENAEIPTAYDNPTHM